MKFDSGEILVEYPSAVADGLPGGYQPATKDYPSWLDAHIDDGYRLAAAMLQDRNLAEDVVQEASIRAWRSAAQLRDRGKARPWFLAIVANEARTASRRRRRDDALKALLAVLLPNGKTHTDAIDEGAEVRAAVKQLSPAQRQVLVLRYFLDLSLEEIGEVLSLRPGTVKSRLHRSLRRVKSLLEEQFGT
jgi:RNA polymerase sigma-70 factor (ECF subfamily)